VFCDISVKLSGVWCEPVPRDLPWAASLLRACSCVPGTDADSVWEFWDFGAVPSELAGGGPSERLAQPSDSLVQHCDKQNRTNGQTHARWTAPTVGMSAPARRGRPAAAAAAGPPKSSRTPCKFFAAGKCTHHPCRFAHTTGNAVAGASSSSHTRKANFKPRVARKPMEAPPSDTCKFSWNRRPCPHGEECRFLHHTKDYQERDDDDRYNEYGSDGDGDHRNSDWYRRG
jgi:hypothetical protein